MENIRKHRKLVAVAGVIAALALVGGALAYWTAGGTGTGTGTVGTSGTVTVTGTVAAGLAPGLNREVTFSAANAGASAVRVTTVHLVSVAADAEHVTCAGADFTMADVTQEHEVPAGATAEALPTPGSLVYANTAVSQDACKGATLTLTLTST